MKGNRLAKKRKSEAVMRGFRKMQAERAAIAADFRQRLLCELNGAPASASRDALIGACVSAHVEITIISARFLEGRANPAALKSLGVARSELRRCLRALKLISGSDADDADATKVPSPAELLAEFREPKESDVDAHAVSAE